MQKISLSNGKVLELVLDEYSESPRKWCNLSKLFFFGEHRHLGDDHDFNSDHYNGWDELENAISKKMDAAIIVPVYAYIHGGMTISLSPFSCPWDSGQLGFAVVTKKDLRENYSIKKVTKKYIEKSMNLLEGEINNLDLYVRGEIYGFILTDKNGNDIDSCFGFFGSNIKENGILDHLDNETRKEIELMEV